MELIVCSREGWLASKLPWYAVNYGYFNKIYSEIQQHVFWVSMFYMKILTKFLKDLGAVKGRLLLFKITIVQKILQIPHITKNFYKILSSKSLLNKEPGPDASVRGGHVHFKLHSSQFVSKVKTVWIGHSPDVYAVFNFFVWP